MLLTSVMFGTRILSVEQYGPSNAEITLVVLDPMAERLACACVQGYARRKYDRLADYLNIELKKTVRVIWAESMAAASKEQSVGSMDVIIGKDSVIRSWAKNAMVPIEGLVHLSDLQGSTMQRGLFVVPASSKAFSLIDLDGYSILFGPENCDEKSTAAKAMLAEIDIDYRVGEECSSCAVAAKALKEMREEKQVAAVISSYASVLLEGCGTVKKGELRIVGQTDEVPFISAFSPTTVDAARRSDIKRALLAIQSTELLSSLESKIGFAPYQDFHSNAIPNAPVSDELLGQEKTAPNASGLRITGDTDRSIWPQWRGVHRDGIVHGIPERWIAPERLWQFDLPGRGIGSIVANDEMVIVSSRDRSDTKDAYFVLDAISGGLIHQLQYDALGKLDYGNSPRAAPVLTEDEIYLQGAMGHLHCIDCLTGEIKWKMNLIDDLGGQLPVWGYTASPLLVDGRLIVQPGGYANSITALDASTGKVLWSAAGKKAAYASPVFAEIGKTKQIIGFNEDSLGGWSLLDGQRLWEIRPKSKGDFNVPTPVLAGNKIVLVSENNGVRIHSFDDQGAISKEPIAESDALAGDSHTPVLLGERLVGVDGDLVVLDVHHGLKELFRFSDPCLQKYTSLIGDEDRVIAACNDGTILLLKIMDDAVKELGRFSTLNDGGELLSHPAYANGVLYVRGTKSIEAYKW